MRPLILIPVVAFLIAGAYFAGRLHRAGAAASGPSAAAGPRKILYYACPMHPQYRSDKPGDAPCCGMRLEPVYAGGPSPAGAIHVAPDTQQLIGVRFATAETAPVAHILHTYGRIASIQEKSVAVVADIYERDIDHISVGQNALVSLAYSRQKRFWAKVDYVFPRMDGATRTIKVRLSAQEPGFQLVSESYCNVDIQLQARPALTVPASAVLDSGVRKRVFVDLGGGYLEPREVETGEAFGDRMEILRGLKKGERVAASGTFLLDSEAQLKAPATALASPVAPRAMESPSAGARVQDREESVTHKDPVCGMSVKETNQRHRSTEFREVKLYFCSETCWSTFMKNPELYGQKAIAEMEAMQPEPHDHSSAKAEPKQHD